MRISYWSSDVCSSDLADAAAALPGDPEFDGLELDAEAYATFLADAEVLVRKYFHLEDPTTITPIGIELKLEAEVGGVRLRGIIDRLELDADGELVVTDYTTGPAPGARPEQQRLAGVAFYPLPFDRPFGPPPAPVPRPSPVNGTPAGRATRGQDG